MTDQTKHGKEGKPVSGNGKRGSAATADAITSVSASLAVRFLERNLEKGRGVYIPALGIKVDKTNLSKG
ncbi:MAG TPA: hypothetical protein VJG32_04205 [Anaerolineae bacterium]|nr:hypothetical protein [Anaerolineae bacterium]